MRAYGTCEQHRLSYAAKCYAGESVHGRGDRRGVNAGERRALWHYRLRGYRILGTNVQAGRNELDLIVRRGSKLTFVEVKQRRGTGFGGAVGAVDAEKRRRVRRAAQVWLSRNPQPDDVRVGFEVVGVEQGGWCGFLPPHRRMRRAKATRARGSCRPRRLPTGALSIG